ncbi:SMP-30/gluconolactonase/LRE family protein [Sulfitobacter mediterraneus]|uniref:Sugar lactone lactonase YvrE n=1 Tax=Sulfitobacter mediterraneus TaxID=83219 RepID=A0A2T6CDJ0_9RHOB|nr:SMP-30/gluconolactonase/LRE family protein [Sulfitobacter mediterraneus]KIN76111.1 SMP-30/Gluconolaconase/LRE-like region superfamily [Sulfitobacter mediterraneus KCTC 32188]PTX73563.1 sugar lactone lactonase YvrE [Sulfitobacter mediterraneus]
MAAGATAEIFDQRRCRLGEGVFWHPLRQQLFWFDILGRKLHSKHSGKPITWAFDEHVSAAGWIDHDTILIASETQLFTFNLETGARQQMTLLEASNPITRSNDGRADPFGGFWIGTMGKNIEAGAGAIYRFYKGQLYQIFDQLTIPNAICFAPDGKVAYFTDTLTQIIHKQPLDNDGWPQGKPQVFADLRAEGLFPDGAVVDDTGHLWNAQWGASRVARYAPDGSFVSAVEFPAQQISCPAFGGSGLDRLFATSAADGLPEDQADQGKTFVIQTTIKGQQEHQVLL